MSVIKIITLLEAARQSSTMQIKKKDVQFYILIQFLQSLSKRRLVLLHEKDKFIKMDKVFRFANEFVTVRLIQGLT